MGRVFKTTATIVASAISRSNRKKTLRNIKKINEANRKLLSVGKVSAEQIIPCYDQIGNVCISGGEQTIRDRLLVQSILQAASLGLPTIVLHENNYSLERELVRFCSGLPFFRIINDTNPYYEPIFRLTDNETAVLIAESSGPSNKIDAAGALYIRALSTLLRKRGVTPYMRMLASCPHNSIQTVILKEEQAGHLTAIEGTAIRNDIQAGSPSRPSIELFFSQLQREASIIAWKGQLSRSTSIQECIKAGGIISIDIGTMAKKTQLAVITTEIEQCLAKGLPCRIALDAKSMFGNERFSSLLKSSSSSLLWTISSPDIGNTVGNAPGETATWLALSHKAILFSHAVHSAELLSKELGEFECVEVTQAHSGNNSIGQFGLHFGANNNVSTSNKRERVVKQEEIFNLARNEFFMIDNNNAALYKGVLT